MKQYIQQGYDAAFILLNYEKPKIKNQKYAAWYKEGFESNKEIKEIQQAGFDLGNQGEDYILPSEYKRSEVIFRQYYEHGLKKNREDHTKTAGGIGFVGLAWLVRRFYVAKKTIS